jgi:hypothetical protein
VGDLVQWLGEQLDEDEQIARGCEGAQWWERPENWVSTPPLNRVALVVHAGNRRHIVEHDPARVLREVTRKRQMLRDADDFCAEYDADIDDDNSAAQRAYCWRDTIRRTLAADYAHRPGYLAEWVPTE